MGDFKHQAYGLIETCKTVINSPRKADPPDRNTLLIAQAILEQAKVSRPSDPVLQNIDFQRQVPTWPGLLAAMTTIVRSLQE